jgi:hypothetical protein
MLTQLLFKRMIRFITLVFCFVIYLPAVYSQTDEYPGKWKMIQNIPGESRTVEIELSIASPERNLLYPAQLTIKCTPFSGVYNLLLVKKNNGQLAISKNKYAVTETPFSMQTLTLFLNNLFYYKKNFEGSFLTLERLKAKRTEALLVSVTSSDDKKLANIIDQVLTEKEIILKKVNPYPWRDTRIDEILAPGAKQYYGIADTVHFKQNTLHISFPDNKKGDNDTISLMLNGRAIAFESDIRKKKLPEEISLDTGLNILTFFADNYGKNFPNSGKINVTSRNKNLVMDFNNPADYGATFIIAKLFYYPGKEDSVAAVRSNLMKQAQQTLNRTTKPVGQMETKSEQIMLAIWDDAVEDGDTISLNINGKWLERGLRVRKQTKFIPVTLDPGPNQITFIAENLGSISPNTSVLEIIDGKIRKAFKIDTNLQKNNLINIFYDFNPEAQKEVQR